MKYKTLHVKNFGPISDAKVELRAVNMFIGEQSIGKSTLAKLITLCTDYVSLCKLVTNGLPSWENLLKEYGLDIYKDYEYNITFDMKQDDSKTHESSSFHLEIRPKKITCYFMDGNKRNTNRPSILLKLIDLNLTKIRHFEELKEKLNAGVNNQEFLNLLTNSLYIPAERIIYSVLTNLMPALALAKSTIPETLLRFMVDLNNAKAEYPDFKIDLLNIAYKKEVSEDLIVLENGKEPIPLSKASSGIQSLVPLILVLHFALEQREYTSFVIEEPECNLFPTKQVELLRRILKVASYPNRTLTITTHSPYLLSAMNNILFAGFLVEKYGEDFRKYIDQIIPTDSLIRTSDCSVYSLGTEINGGVYCQSLIDPETNMIDFNSLDGVSEELGNEFDDLQRAAVRFSSDR